MLDRDPEPVVLASGSLDQMRELARALASKGVASQLLQPPDGCGSS